MSTSMVGRTLLVMSPSLSHDERIELIVSIMYDWAVIMPIFVIWGVLPYGRYNTTSAVFSVNAQLAWALQVSLELTAFTKSLISTFINLYFF